MKSDNNTAIAIRREDRPNLHGRTVLLADDDELLLEALRLHCRELGLRVQTATDGVTALLKTSRLNPDLLILDLNLPDVEGFKVLERLIDTKYSPVPVIILTGRDDEEAIRKCEKLGALHLQKSERTWEQLEPLISKVFRERPKESDKPIIAEPEQHAKAPTRILLVDDDRFLLQTLSTLLKKHGFGTITADNGMQGFWLALREQPDLVITDYNMPESGGHYLLTRVKNTPSTEHIPVIVYTGRPLTQGQELAIERDLRGRGKAAAFLLKPAGPAAFIEALRKHIAFPV